MLINKPTCKLCHVDVAVKGGNTTNLFSHLKHKHPKEYSELKLKDPKQAVGSNTQPTIHQAFAQSQKYLKTSKRWQKLIDSVTKCIAMDMLLLHTVDKPGFRKMLQCFDSLYELPTRKYFTQTAIPTLYSKVRDTVEQELQEILMYSRYVVKSRPYSIHELYSSLPRQKLAISKPVFGNFFLIC